MGTYTANQKFYKPNSDELVSVEQDLNYNLRRADQRVKPLVEYQWTDEGNITNSSLPKDTGFKWYKSYTNSVWHYHDGTVSQDPNSKIDTWSSSVFTWEPGYKAMDNEENNVAATVFNNMVRFRGRIVRDDNSEIPANTTVNLFTLAEHLRPVTQKYFTIYGGNASGDDFQCFRFYIPAATSTDLRCEFIKYGGNATNQGERYFSIADVFYALDT